MIILANLKEQLRKKSIHFFFCSPVLYEESKSSMYIFETMFIDYETKESYSAFKTREGYTLGHVRIPHPLKVLEDGSTLANPKLLEEYQAKKDKHLEKVLGNTSSDVFQERADAVTQTPLFLRAEKLYKAKLGYVPQTIIVQVVNKLYPEYQSGIVPVEIAARIKFDKELSGEWDLSTKAPKEKQPKTKSKRGKI
jgi:hypothetical protein